MRNYLGTIIVALMGIIIMTLGVTYLNFHGLVMGCVVLLIMLPLAFLADHGDAQQ